MPTAQQIHEFLNKLHSDSSVAGKQSVYQLLYDYDFILKDFDWTLYPDQSTQQKAGGKVLKCFDSLSEPEMNELLKVCNDNDYFKILTAAVRGARFCDGYWEEFVASGALRICLNAIAKSVGYTPLLVMLPEEVQCQQYLLKQQEESKLRREQIKKRKDEQRIQESNDDQDFLF
ncbi:DUF6508 domain-containing protein [Vibrio sp. Isolate34]|uniref:DUF6508 domain-containing protein n=1 Tax=Vibrio sp. Isolate34 TaxID=2908540 RepID=UPI001EFEB375|nr:DUF6508 domain-containing protein [Vibrio sp. Isolate34]MCG9640313.1 DUF6508 domain-containing protein [Vibrio sp. Isolate34]